MPAASEKNAMFAGLCWKLAASKKEETRGETQALEQAPGTWRFYTGREENRKQRARSD
jgi:hypothetical protein